MSNEEFATQTADAVTPDSAPVVEAAQVEAPVEPAVDQGSAPDDDKVPKHIEELKTQRRKRQEAEREAAYWRGRAEGGVPEKRQEAPQAPVQQTVPTIDQFETYEEYEAARDDYLIRAAEHRFAQKMQEQQALEEQQRIQQTFQQRIAEASAADPTIADIVSDPTLPVSAAMVPLLQQSEVAPELLKYLDNNRTEAKRIAGLPPLLAARAIGALEVKLQNTPKPTPPAKVSMAPEPIKTVNALGAGNQDQDSMSMDEWMKKYGGPARRR